MSQSPIETRTAATESGDHPISQAVVETVADAENVDPIDIEVPLFDVVDPDALDAFYRSARDNASVGLTSIDFSYYGYQIRVDETGVTVTE